MRCVFCKHKDTKVTNKRDVDHSSRRRRECLNCKKRFTTYEKAEPIERYVVKKDGRRELFNRDKAFLGIIKSCEKRNIPHETAENIIKEIEEKLLEKNREIKTEKIGEYIMKKLKRLDKVAYIRFASVYKDFTDINDFNDVLKEVKK